MTAAHGGTYSNRTREPARKGPDISIKTGSNRDRVEPAEPERAPGGRTPPWAREAAGGAEAASLGAWLRRQREVREIDLREIADRTKISLRYLKAMEQDRFDVLPAPIFAKGFLREYAKYVGLDPDEVVNFFLAAHPESDAAGEPETPSSHVRQRPGLAPWVTFAALVLVVLVVLAVVGYLAFYAENRRSATRRPPPAASQPSASPAGPPGAPAATSEPAPPVPEETVAATPAPLAVTLDFTGECWIEVVVDGRQRIEELHVQGESLQIAAQESVLLATIGDPSSVEVQVNGLPFELVGPSGRPVHDVRIDLETVGGMGPGPA